MGVDEVGKMVEVGVGGKVMEMDEVGEVCSGI